MHLSMFSPTRGRAGIHGHLTRVLIPWVGILILFDIACSRLLERGAKESARGRKRGGNGGEKKRERRGACNHFLKHLMPVYQLPVYLLIGQFDSSHITRKISPKNLKESKWRVCHTRVVLMSLMQF